MTTTRELSNSEQRLTAAVRDGQAVDFRTGNPDTDNPVTAATWGRERQVRAEVLADLVRNSTVSSGVPFRVVLRGVVIRGLLDLAELNSEITIEIDNCHLGDGINLEHGSIRALLVRGSIAGPICLDNARITKLADFNGSRIEGDRKPALTCYRMVLSGDMFCEDGFATRGHMVLAGAAIGGHLRLNGARLGGNGQDALSCYRMDLKGDLFCEESFVSQGRIVLAGATIGGDARLRDVQLISQGTEALNADEIKISGNMFCNTGFNASGGLSLVGATIGGELSLNDAQVNGQGGNAVNAERISVAGVLSCSGKFHAEGQVVLLRARVGVLADNMASWPSELELRGFRYDGLDPYMPARSRLRWVRLSTIFRPETYEQLATYYRHLGHDDQARRVLLAKQRERTRQQHWWIRWWGWLQDALVGYGYASGRALVLLAVAFCAGWFLFRSHPPLPVDMQAHPTFNAAIYTLDLLVPAPGLGQSSDWNPSGLLLGAAVGLRILGWLLAISIVAAVTRALSRN